MTAKQSATLVAYLAAADTRAVVGEATLAVWIEHLEPLDVALCRRAADVIVKSDDRFPSIARFMDVYRAEKREEARRMAESHGLPEPDRAAPDPETLEALVESGLLTTEAADRLLKASGGDEEHAARVANQAKG